MVQVQEENMVRGCEKRIYQNDTSTLDDMIIGLELYQKHIYQNMIKGELKTDYGSELHNSAYTKTSNIE